MSFTKITKKKILTHIVTLRTTFVIKNKLMIDQLKTIRTFPLLNRFNEDAKYNQILYSASMFPYITKLSSGNLNKLVLNFSFRDIHFNKKQALPFFLALELLTKQKCIATVSSKNILV